MCFDQVTGMRTTPKPALATALSSSGVVFGLPHAVSPSGTSRLLPRFQPRPSVASNSADVCVNARGRCATAGAVGLCRAPPLLVLAAGGVVQEPANSAQHA